MKRILGLILEKLDSIEKDQQEIKQESIKEFIINLDDTLAMVKKDHEFIERLKKAVGEYN